MLRLLGYTDRLSVAPGQTIRFMVSCDRPEYDARLVRLIHGDENPDGPGFKQISVPSAIDGRYAGRHQAIRSGSYVEIPLALGAIGASLAFSVYLMPTNPGTGEQVIASIGDPSSGSGWGLVLSDGGAVELFVGPTRISTGTAVHRWTWYQVECTIEGGRGVVRQTPIHTWPNDGSAGEGYGDVSLPSLAGPLILGAMRTFDGMAGHLDGKLDDPVLAGVGAWDFAADISSDRVTDRSPGGHHGWTVNTPTRAITGHRFDGTLTDFHLAPEQWSAIHLHRDDLDDAGWDVGFSLTVPDDLPSGVYAAWLRSGDDEDHLPFTVRPPRGTSRSSRYRSRRRDHTSRRPLGRPSSRALPRTCRSPSR